MRVIEQLMTTAAGQVRVGHTHTQKKNANTNAYVVHLRVPAGTAAHAFSCCHASFVVCVCVCMCVCVYLQVGVDINLAANVGWHQHVLQFVPGLGPRKAQALLQVCVCVCHCLAWCYLPPARPFLVILAGGDSRTRALSA